MSGIATEPNRTTPTRTRFGVRTITLLAAIAFAACGESSPIGPEPEPVNAPPTITSLSMADDGYSRARLTGSASDPEGAMATVEIDWGDGSTTTVDGDPASISVSHRYDRAQDYTTTLTVTDAEGLTAQRTSSIRIEVPDPVCLDLLKIVGVCINGTLNLRNFELEARVLNQVVYRSEIRDGQGDLRIPLPGGAGNLRIRYNMDTGRVTISGEVCPVPFLVCEEIASRTIQLGS